MEIIDELEPVKRGVYGGAVGYLSWSGNMDTAIAIRTVVVKDGEAILQAGAGIVADSVPTVGMGGNTEQSTGDDARHRNVWLAANSHFELERTLNRLVKSRFDHQLSQALSSRRY